MLASPGHSPRHVALLSSPAPSHGASGPSRSSTMGPPPPKRPRKPVVLDEDVYVSAIERIILRDYFPDLPKLQNRLEWLEAVRSGDPVIIRDTQLRIIQRRAERTKGGTPSIAGTPASVMVTPGIGVSPVGSVRSELGLGFVTTAGGAVGGPGSVETGNLPDTSLSLDNFMRKYTSEDNASFAEIKERDDRKKRVKVERQLAVEQVSESLKLSSSGKGSEGEEEEESKKRLTDGFGTSGQSNGSLVTWDYKGRNLLMYDSSNRPDAPLTNAELHQRTKGPPKEINKRSTRFHGKVFEGRSMEDDAVAILYTPVAGATPIPFAERDAARARQHYDLEDLRRTPRGGEGGGSNSGSGYGMVHTPSPAPGVDESPFMTWGEIEGTPIRLEAEDTPIGIGGRADGPHFKIPAQPARDEAAHTMSRSAARSLRERNKMQSGGGGGGGGAGGGGGVLGTSPATTPGSVIRSFTKGGGGASPSVGGLSVAAQKLVSKALRRNNAAMDPNLRASYGGSTPDRSPFSKRHRDSSLPLRSPSASPSLQRGGSGAQKPTPSPVAGL